MLAIRAYYSSLRFSPLQYLFSDISKMHLSLNAQRSVLATAVIREITDSPPPMSFSDLSLREKILKLNPLINNTEISPQVKNQIFQLFTTGIKLNPNIYFLFKEEKQREKNLIFCPNYLTTRPIFQQLMKQSESKNSRLCYSEFGMAKTISFILYMHISNYIHRFYQQAQCSQEAKLELQQLSKENLIKVVPRCWYWGISPAHHNNDRFSVTNLIFQQTIDLPSQKREILKKHLEDSDEFKFHFLKFYPDQIQKRVIADQVQTMLLMAREWNSLCLSKDSKIYRSSRFKQQIEFTQSEIEINVGFRQLMHYLDQLQIYGDYYIYGSSVQPLYDQLQRAQRYRLGIAPYDNRYYYNTEIKSSRSLAGEKWGVVDFWQYFWFQVQRILIDKQVSINLQETKKVFFKNCEEKAVGAKSYFRFSDITNFLNSQAVSKSINVQSNKEYIEKTVCGLRELFGAFCLQEQTKKITKFFEKGQRDQRLQYLSELHKLAVTESSKSNKDLVLEQSQLIAKDKHDQVVGYRQESENNKKTIKFNLSSSELAQVLGTFLNKNHYKEQNKNL